MKFTMKLKVAVALSFFAAVPAMADTCTNVIRFDNGNLEFQACRYDSGGSGYYTWSNESSSDMEICWTLTFPNGSSEKGCHSSLNSGQQSRASCVLCRDLSINVNLTKLIKKP
jgi:hypothetical protein